MKKKLKLKDGGDPCIKILPLRCPRCGEKLLAWYRPLTAPRKVCKDWYIECDTSLCDYEYSESFDTIEDLQDGLLTIKARLITPDL
jgi:hypothetical protein